MSKKNKYLILFNNITSRFPLTYPRPKLIIHPTQKDLRNSYWSVSKFDKNYDEPPIAWCNIKDFSVHVALTHLREESFYNISFYFLHEIGHLFFIHKYGSQDFRWLDDKLCETYADNFAKRWLKKMELEGFF